MLTRIQQRNGQMAGYEFAIIVVLLVTNGATLYFLINKSESSSVYQKGSKPTVTNIERRDWPFSIHIGEGGCARLDSLKGTINANSVKTSH